MFRENTFWYLNNKFKGKHWVIDELNNKWIQEKVSLLKNTVAEKAPLGIRVEVGSRIGKGPVVMGPKVWLEVVFPNPSETWWFCYVEMVCSQRELSLSTKKSRVTIHISLLLLPSLDL